MFTVCLELFCYVTWIVLVFDTYLCIKCEKRDLKGTQMAVLETPWFMKTKTSDLRKVNQVFEERLQRQVTILEIKQRRSLLKIDDQINIIRRDMRRIRSEVDFSTDLDEFGRKVDPDATRSKSTGDMVPGVDRQVRPLTKSALLRHNIFVKALDIHREIPTETPVLQILRDKYGEGSEVRNLQNQLQKKVMPPIKIVKRKKKSKRKACSTLSMLGTIKDSDRDDDVFTNDNGLRITGDRLPSRGDSARDRRFSVSTPRKRTHDQLPSINSVDKLTKTTSKSREI